MLGQVEKSVWSEWEGFNLFGQTDCPMWIIDSVTPQT